MVGKKNSNIRKEYFFILFAFILLSIMAFQAGKTEQELTQCSDVIKENNRIIMECNAKIRECNRIPQEFNLTELIGGNSTWNLTKVK